VDASHELPAGHELRPPRAEEATDIAHLVEVTDASFGEPPSMSEDFIREFWTRPRFFLETDAWVVEHGGTVVGYAAVWDMDPTRVSAMALVHPDHTGRGIGAHLATLVEERAAEKVSGDARLFTATLTQDETAARLLIERGYSFARRFWHMEGDIGTDPQAPKAPVGIRLRRLDPERDLSLVHRVLDEAFEDHWDYSPTPFEEFVERDIAKEDFDPSLWILATDGIDPVGVLSASAHTDRGWVNDIGVLRSHRGRGIATALLLESFVEFGRRGLSLVRLNVDSENMSGAVGLYERVGMRAVNSYDLWSRVVGPQKGAGFA
jgi:mycothiol synthase